MSAYTTWNQVKGVRQVSHVTFCLSNPHASAQLSPSLSPSRYLPRKCRVAGPRPPRGHNTRYIYYALIYVVAPTAEWGRGIDRSNCDTPSVIITMFNFIARESNTEQTLKVTIQVCVRGAEGGMNNVYIYICIYVWDDLRVRDIVLGLSLLLLMSIRRL
ncbi:hypothetical protein K504DRAFT_277323 [Pleomassaria siparia CBS 279.74]|uniref:Uncharacterized protein n=1 Tax=Pleomassaria siparia CBS 279.74 TaxID=1314801 RepID=A0A6G1K9S2_9PLEO|nr:hypothetical protein K504DRAFT_277323 [Pleomassaria siparia CBS 279.74]